MQYISNAYLSIIADTPIDNRRWFVSILRKLKRVKPTGSTLHVSPASAHTA